MRNTRQQNDLYIPITLTIASEREISVRDPSLWNKLPGNIKTATYLNKKNERKIERKKEKERKKAHLLQNQK